MISTALGPFVGAALATMLHGYAAMFLTLGAVGALAAVCATATSTHRMPIGTSP
jgi:MFS family permease